MRQLLLRLCFWLIQRLAPGPHIVLRAKGRRPLQVLQVEQGDFVITGAVPRQRYRDKAKGSTPPSQWPVRYLNQGMLDGDFWLIRVGDGHWRKNAKWGL